MGIKGNEKIKMKILFILIGISLLFLGLVLYIPAINVFYQAFHKGVGPFLHNLSEPNFQHAVRMTVALAVISVPLNTLFGLATAWALARKRFRGRTLLLSIVDLPFAISPVVAGLMIVLLYGRNGWPQTAQCRQFRIEQRCFRHAIIYW